MMHAKTLRAMLAAGLGGLCLLAGLQAEDKPKAEPGKPAAAADDPAPMRPAIKPKPLSETVKKGLEYLVKTQHASGGWGQGGGWRVGDQGGRVEGAQVQDPPDVGNTCAAVLALIRAGNTPREGPYAKNVARGVEFICSHVEKADKDSLYVTDVRGTQLQSKIGPFVDTFLTSLVLSELKGKMPDPKAEKRLVAAIDKTVTKMVKHQRKDGTFADNHGWAAVLSQSLANKGFNYAAQRGVAVAQPAIANVQKQVAANFDSEKGAFRSPTAGTGGIGAGGVGLAGLPPVATPVSGPVPVSGKAPPAPASVPTGLATAPSDAGVPLYTASSYVTNAADIINTYSKDLKKAQAVLKNKTATVKEKEEATATLKKIEEADKLSQETTAAVVKQLDQPQFVQGFGSNGGEEFLSFWNLSEALLVKGDEWKKWDEQMTKNVSRVQDRDGSWSGHHCITGKTFCTSTALLVLMADRAPIPVVKDEKPQK